MQHVLDAITQGASGPELASLSLPEAYRAAFVRRDDVGMFEGIASADKDPRKSLHVGEVATPTLAPDEAGVLTPGALELVADLQRELGGRREELLRARAERQERILSEKGGTPK